MTEKAFRAALRAAGFACTTFDIPAGINKAQHSHPWDARLLLLEGELTITAEAGEQVLSIGGTCEVLANTLHTELTGKSPARGLIGKRAA